MSFAARRMMGAAARRAFHSQRPSSSRISITKEEPREKANLPQVLCQLDTMTRRQVVREIENRSKIVRIDANPSRGPADGVIWYGRTWANNLAAVFLVSAWYGMSQKHLWFRHFFVHYYRCIIDGFMKPLFSNIFLARAQVNL